MSIIKRPPSILTALLKLSASLLTARFGLRLIFSRGGVPGPPTVPTFPDPLQERQRQPRDMLVGFLDIRPGMRVVVVCPEPAEAVLRAAQQAGTNGKVIVTNAQRATVEGLKPELDKM